MKNTKSYYHITPIENLQSILQSGLIRNGYGIFLVDTNNQFVIDSICLNQIFSRSVAILKISPDGLSEIYKDNVSEITKYHQFYTKQKKIKPEFIEVYAVFQITEDDVLENKVEYYKTIGLNYTKDQVRKIIEFLQTTNKDLQEGNLAVDQANILSDKFNQEMSSWQ
jgi:hypothetical protein